MVGLYAIMAGPLAAKFLHSSTFEVVARFDRSFYIQGEQGLFCLGRSDLEAGPINVLCRQWPCEENLPSPGTTITKSRNLMSWEHGYIDLSGMHEWLPPGCPPVNRNTLFKSLGSLSEIIDKSASHGGLASLLLPHSEAVIGEGLYQDTLVKIAGDAVQDLRSWMRQETAVAMSLQSRFPEYAVKSLIGLGPGLTPSGDDLLGGMLIALHATGQTGLAETLWSCIENAIAGTNDISRAHLLAASQGMGADVIHQLIVSLISGQSLDDTIERLGRVGHSSGWDAAVGVLLVLDACSE